MLVVSPSDLQQKEFFFNFP